MRYDTKIMFRKITPGAYDSSTGNYAPDTWQDDKEWASIMDTKAEMLQLIYGRIVQGSLTVHIPNLHEKPFDQIIIDGKPYSVDFARKLRGVRHVFIVSEVQ